MQKIGVVEGFFGPAWPKNDRKSYAEFLSHYGGDFYIYAPKQDYHLRKGWRAKWEEAYIQELADLAQCFHSHKIQFGMGFSPFGLGETLSSEDRISLKEKLGIMNNIGIDMLGLFFDDMPINANLARTQIEAYQEIKKSFHKKIIFCPSFYTPDPILDKVFGQRPEHYLEDIAEGLPLDVAIAWTGPKVISPVIDQAHLTQVREVLKRKPFIWENLFANDGPRNCKFLKLKDFSGRDRVFSETEAFAFNLMNQPELSKILFLASSEVLKNATESKQAFEKALSELCTPEFKAFILRHQDSFLNQGLDAISPAERESWLQELKQMNDPGAQEMRDWLNGKYLVGTECLTD